MKTIVSKKRISLIAALALVLILACALVMSGSLGKYKSRMVVANEVDYTNQLAESFTLLDNPVIVQEDGSYAVDTASGAQPTDGFSYKLIPGIDIPAAPYIEITNKTVIPAYLYLEIDNSGPAELVLGSGWTKLDGVTGKKGGTVYSYGSDALTGGETPTQADGSQADVVLKYPAFTVQKLSSTPVTDEGEVKVYAYLIQKVENQTAKEAFESAPLPS